MRTSCARMWLHVLMFSLHACAGVGVATITDVQLNTTGMIFGALAVVFTAQFQIMQGDKQVSRATQQCKRAALVSTRMMGWDVNGM